MFTRRLRRMVSGMIAAALLFAQVAIAAYICPVAAKDQAVGATADVSAGMAPCAEMASTGVALDAEQAGLCLQHCQFGTTQAASYLPQAQALASPPLAPTFLSPPRIVVADSSPAQAVRQRSRDRPPPVGHSIAHCCFRL